MSKFQFREGVDPIVKKVRISSAFAAGLSLFALFVSACSDGPGGPSPSTEVAARVNGREIKMEEVEKAIKAQAQGTETSFSQLELTSARLSVLQQLIQTEVMFQKAEKEQSVPSDEEVTAEMNNRRTNSGLSREEFEKQMAEAGETEESWRLNVKKEMSLQRLQDKITGRVEAPSDTEIEAFYTGNREQFKNKRGVELAAIVIDPSDSGPGDPTTNEAEAQLRLKEIAQRLSGGTDFATVAREFSEDLETRARGGDWRYFTEEELRQVFGGQVADVFMKQLKAGDIFPSALPLDGRILVVKMLRRQEQDEDLTLESPTVRPRITELLINARKNLLWQSYMALAINEAKVENLLARKVVDNPNELSGARPAPTPTPEGQANGNANTANANANASANAANTANTNAVANTNGATNANNAANAGN